MNETTSVKRSFNLQRKNHGRRAVVSGTAPTPPPVGRLPRITRLMALAIHFDDLLRTGAVRSQAELAEPRPGHPPPPHPNHEPALSLPEHPRRDPFPSTDHLRS